MAPSSQILAREMVRGLDEGGTSRLVELGPGTGAFTGARLERLAPGGHLLAVELDPGFARKVQLKWPAADCVCASATTIDALVAERGMQPVDHIISGLPFASLPTEATGLILDGIKRVLKPGGTFTAFQYVHAYPLSIFARFAPSVSSGIFRRRSSCDGQNASHWAIGPSGHRAIWPFGHLAIGSLSH